MSIRKKFDLLNIMCNIYKMNQVKELKIDNALWAKPAKIVNLLDFNPEK